MAEMSGGTRLLASGLSGLLQLLLRSNLGDGGDFRLDHGLSLLSEGCQNLLISDLLQSTLTGEKTDMTLALIKLLVNYGGALEVVLPFCVVGENGDELSHRQEIDL